MELAGSEVAMKLVVFLSAVILLHQVCDASEYQKWTAQSQSDTVWIVADNILLCTFIQLRSVYKQGSTAYIMLRCTLDHCMLR